MKRLFVLACAVVFAMTFVGTVFAASKTTWKKGDEVYVCECGAACPCLTMSKKAGKCDCGKDLVKTTIDKVAKGKAYVTVNGKTLVLKTTGKYACACGAGCACDTISQKPGKCSCDKPMQAVKGKKKVTAQLVGTVKLCPPFYGECQAQFTRWVVQMAKPLNSDLALRSRIATLD